MSNDRRAEPTPRGRGRGRSITEWVRRQQIVEAAIATIAEVGIGSASFARIAQRAGLSSTGIISYHFAGRSDLINAVVARVVADGQAYIGPRIRAAEPGADQLRTYITANLEFMAENPDGIVAVADVLSVRDADTQKSPYAEFHTAGIEHLSDFFQEGQKKGLFCEFDTSVMALAIRAAIDEAGYRCRAEPDFDPIMVGNELAELFVRAAAVEGSSQTRV